MRTVLLVLVLLQVPAAPVRLQVITPGPLSGTAMTVTITVPTSSATYDAGTSATLTISGTAQHDPGTSTCTWANSLGGSGTATGTASWSISNMALTVGSNVVTVTCVGVDAVTNNDVITVTRSTSGGFTDDPAALWVVASGGATTGSCPVGTPCTITRALAAVADNGTIILNAGTYGDITFQGTNHDGVTLTTTAAIKNALTFICNGEISGDCGIVSGSDGRPISSGINIGTASSGSTGPNNITISYLILDGGTATNGFGAWVVGVEAGVSGTVIDHNVIRDAGGGIAMMTGSGTITNNYIHNHGANGWPTCGGSDAHNIALYHFAAGTRQPGFTIPTSFANGMVIRRNTLTDGEGDGFQDVGDQSSSLFMRFLEFEDNHVLQNCEQAFDTKGLRDALIHGNDLSDSGNGCLISTNDEDGAVEYQQLRWQIYDNYLHDSDTCGIFSQEGDDGTWDIWNNVITRVCRAYAFHCAAIQDPPPDTRIENNTIVDNNRVSGSNEVSGIGWPNAAHAVTIKNNILYNNGNSPSSRGNISTGGNGSNVVDNNRIFPTSPGVTGTGADTSAANDFTNSATDDYTLVSGAQSVDAATTLTPRNATHTIATDILGVARPQGAAWDHGAYERP